MYYRDPDGNEIELQIDNYDDIEEATAFGKYAQAHAYTPEAIQRAVSRARSRSPSAIAIHDMPICATSEYG